MLSLIDIKMYCNAWSSTVHVMKRLKVKNDFKQMKLVGLCENQPSLKLVD